MDNFERDLIKHKRNLAQKINAYLQFLEDNGIQMTLSDEQERVENVYLCRDVCAKKYAK